ncbi:MAG: hypothetical protein JWM02_302 [Frankiales bacterium]|nr:hypothetical protein [Frankiales bacterium]
MTDPTRSRGPDFLPYPLPARPAATVVAPAPPAPTRGRWERALDGVTPWGVAAITAGVVALLSLVVVSLLAGHRGTGAVIASLAAVAAVGAGLRALKDEQPVDSKNLVKGGMATGVTSAVIALLLLLTNRSAVAEQPPIQVPSPVPSTTSSPQPQPQSPTPAPGTPQPGPSVGVLPPGTSNQFGVPSQPGPPLTQTSTDKGTLTGRVLMTGGAPLPGATVVVTRADPSDTSDSPACPLRVVTRTGTDGRYTLQLCQLGNFLGYTVTISADTAKATADLFVNAGQTTVYNVILPVRHA